MTCKAPVLTSNLKDRLSAFMLMIRQFRNITSLKRAGRAHAEGGVMATAPGELALPCRACPHPGKNLKAGWEKAPPQFAYVAILTLHCSILTCSVDFSIACFLHKMQTSGRRIAIGQARTRMFVSPRAGRTSWRRPSTWRMSSATQLRKRYVIYIIFVSYHSDHHR